MSDESSWVKLPDELLRQTFTLLESRDLVRAGGVCKCWNTLSSEEHLWKRLNVVNQTLEVLEALCHHHPNATELHVKGRNESRLNVERGLILLGDLEILIWRSIWPLINYHHEEVHITHDSLLQVQVRSCSTRRIWIAGQRLEKLSLHLSILEGDGLHIDCGGLRELTLGYCAMLSEAVIRLIVTACPLLEYVEMTTIHVLTEETLREIALNCSHLCTLKASHMRSLTSFAIHFPALRVLSLHRCNMSSFTASSTRLPALRVLSLHQCKGLTKVQIYNKTLETFSLLGCGAVTSLTLACPVLLDVHLDPVHVRSLSLAKCPKLKRLTIVAPR